jgi:hypothetical protein
MKVQTASAVALLSVAAALLLVPTERAAGCAAAVPYGSTVQIADESAIIIWDSASKTEHFIRRATFNSSAHDFGFLVPTPTKPELAEAGDEAFTTLAVVTAPKVVTRSAPPSNGGGCGCGVMAPGQRSVGDAALPNVSVLDAKRVAGYDAVVLEADDANALGKWLKDHGYDFSPALTTWVQPYIKAKWKLSAFKIARDETGNPTPAAGTARTSKATDTSPPPPSAPAVATSAVRMTFHTEKPFFPYREPAAKPSAAPTNPGRRLLRVYFLADGCTKGTLGEAGQAWPGRVVWANKLEGPDREKTLTQLKLANDTPPAAMWLTEFEDHSSPRPGTDDVYFSLDDNQAPVERPPNIQYVSADLPVAVVLYGLALFVLVPRLLRSWRRP